MVNFILRQNKLISKSPSVPKDIQARRLALSHSAHPDRLKTTGQPSAEIMTLQRNIGNAAVMRLLKPAAQPTIPGGKKERRIQRKVVYTVGTDSITSDSYTKLTSGGETGLNQLLADPQHDPKQLLRQRLGPDEELVIIGHGDGRGRIENFDAQGLLTHLMDLGFDPSIHKGPINLFSCFSATKQSGAGVVFADVFSRLLQTKGFSNPVIGYKGYVLPFGDKVKVVPMHFKDKFDGLKMALEQRKNISTFMNGFKDAMDEAKKAAVAGDDLGFADWVKTANHYMADLDKTINLINFAFTEVDKVAVGLDDDVVNTYQTLPPPSLDTRPKSDNRQALLKTALDLAGAMQNLSLVLSSHQPRVSAPSSMTQLLSAARNVADSLKNLAQVLSADDLNKAAQNLESSIKS